MKKELLIPILFLLCASKIMSQGSEYTSYVVLESGDTLFGEVQRIKKTRNGIKFLKKLTYRDKYGKKKRFAPSALAGYTIDGNIYRKYNMELVQDLRLIKNYYRFVPYGGEEVFLGIWLEGPLSHFEYEYIDGNDDSLSRFSLLQKEDQQYLVKVSHGLFGIRKKALMEYFDDCPSLLEKVKEGVIDTAQDIVNHYYNDCLD